MNQYLPYYPALKAGRFIRSCAILEQQWGWGWSVDPMPCNPRGRSSSSPEAGGGALQAAQRLSSLLLDEHFSSAPSLILHATLLKQVNYCLSQLFEISHKMQILIEN